MDIITQDTRFRQGVVKYSYNNTVKDAAIRYKVSERSIYRWRDRYDGALESLKDKSRRTKATGGKARNAVFVRCCLNGFGNPKT